MNICVDSLSPAGRMPRTGDIGFMSVCASVLNRGGILCARLSPNRFTYLHILGANKLYNHCSFHFDLTSFQIQEKVTKNLVFLHTLYKTGGTLCARLSPNRFTYLHIPGANQ